MRWLFITVALAAFAPSQEKPDWTILVYMCADCDLESYAVRDLAEFAKIKTGEAVRIVIQCDRAEEDEPEDSYSGEDVAGLGNFKSAKRLVVENGGLKELADLGETNTGDPKTLSDFVAWGLKAYPAKHTALVFWDHGAGWAGFGGDDSADGDMLTLDELDAALGSARFDLVGFDACLMANLDVMNACRRHAKLMVASEDVEPGTGWPYAAWLASAAGKSPEALAKSLCDAYKDFYEKSDDEDNQAEALTNTLSVVDLEKIPAVSDAVGALADSLGPRLREKKLDAWKPVAKARHGAEEYGRAGWQDACYLYDLQDLAQRLHEDALAKAVEAAVLYRVAGRERPNARGMSMYFPPSEKKHEEFGAEYPKAKWWDFLKTYFDVQALDKTPPEISKLKTTLAELSKDESAEVTASVSGDDVGETYFVLEKNGAIVGTFPVEPDGEKVSSGFDGVWLTIGDEKNRILAPVESYEAEDDTAGVAGIPAVYTPKGGKESKVTLYFELDWGKDPPGGDFLFAYEFAKTGPREVEIAEGARIAPVFPKIAADHRWEHGATAAALTVGAEGLKIVLSPLDDGTYRAGFVAVDFAENAAEATVEIRIKRK